MTDDSVDGSRAARAPRVGAGRVFCGAFCVTFCAPVVFAACTFFSVVFSVVFAGAFFAGCFVAGAFFAGGFVAACFCAFVVFGNIIASELNNFMWFVDSIFKKIKILARGLPFYFFILYRAVHICLYTLQAG